MLLSLYLEHDIYTVSDIVCNKILQAHTNETIGSVRQKVAVRLRTVADQVQIVANDKMVSQSTIRNTGMCSGGMAQNIIH